MRNWHKEINLFLATVIILSACAPAVRAQPTITTDSLETTATPTLRPTLNPEKMEVLPTSTEITTTTLTQVRQTNPINWGVFSGDNIQTLKLIETIGTKPNMVATFVELDGSGYFPNEMAQLAKDQGAKLVIYLETQETNNEMQDVETNIWINEFADKAKNSGVEIVLVPMPEVNLDEDLPWGKDTADNTPESFLKVWGIIAKQFEGIENVELALALNEVTLDEEISEYIPPPDQVDILGVDGFNWDTRNPSDIFESTLSQLDRYRKTMCILSTGTGGNDEEKSAWYQELFKFMKKRNLECVVVFSYNKERNWQIEGEETLETFREYLSPDLR